MISTVPISKKNLIGIVAALGAILLVASFFLVRWFGGGSNSSRNNASETPGITHITLNRSAYDIALARASTWHPDAALMKMASVDQAGAIWNFTFISPKANGRGFVVAVAGQNVVRADEIALSGGGAPLPANVISPDQAIAMARAVPGYGNATFTSVEMLYNAAARQWYWGVKAANGTTLTIKAAR